jgi:hypothetical protein
VNPKEFNFQLDNGEGQFSLAEFLQNKVANSTDPAAEFQKLEPPFLGYRKLLALLASSIAAKPPLSNRLRHNNTVGREVDRLRAKT